MNYKKRITPEAMRTLAHGSIGAGYTAIGVATEFASFLLIINNYTDAQLTFSLDGATDHFELASGNSLTIDVTANKSHDMDIYLPAKTTVYVKQSGAPSSGSVYVSSLYGG